MDIDDLMERIRFGFLRASSCTAVQVERRASEVLQAWRTVKRERRALDRDKRMWFDGSPRPVDERQPFCFALDRMKRKWRDADRRADLSGLAVHRTVGSTRARERWFDILGSVLHGDELVRVRHRYHDEPVLLMRESRFRQMERAAARRDRRPRAPSRTDAARS